MEALLAWCFETLNLLSECKMQVVHFHIAVVNCNVTHPSNYTLSSDSSFIVFIAAPCCNTGFILAWWFSIYFLFIIPQSQCDVKCPSSLLFCLSLMRVEMKCVVRGGVKTASWPPSSKQGGVGPGPATTASLCKLISGTHVLLWPSQTILQVGQGKVTVESWSNMMTR